MQTPSIYTKLLLENSITHQNVGIYCVGENVKAKQKLELYTNQRK